MTTNWRVADPDALHWRSWGREHILYNDASGDTHCIGEDAAALIRAIAVAPADRDALRSVIADVSPETSGDDLDGKLDALLAAMTEAGLLEAA